MVYVYFIFYGLFGDYGMIETSIFLLFLIFVILSICFLAMMYAIEESDNGNKKDNKRLYRKNDASAGCKPKTEGDL